MSDDKGEFGGGEWMIDQFGVIPNPVSPGGKGPVVVIRQDDLVSYIPMESDDDVDNLYRRVRGSEP